MQSQKAIVSTAFFPPVQYICKFLQYDEVFVELFENYSKQSYRNRCEIMNANGLLGLSVPVVQGNSKTLIKDLRISYSENWQKDHFKAIESAYRASPYYEFYIHDFLFVFKDKPEFLFDLNNKILQLVFSLLRLDFPIQFTSDFEFHPLNKDDWRNTIHPKKHKKGKDNSLLLKPYNQAFSYKIGFMPNLSILDVLFNLGPDSKAYLGSCIL